MEPIPDTPAQFRARIDADLARWAPVIEAANIKINYGQPALKVKTE